MEEKSTQNIEAQAPQGLTRFNSLLCRVGGSDLGILSQCPREIPRYARVGAIIISTALLAFFSMFCAIQTISQSVTIGLAAGAVWAVVIFILDSYIIASYKKNDNKWTEFKIVIPRLVLALVLGCSISIPMELKVFQTEINDELVSMKLDRNGENEKSANDLYQKKTKSLRDRQQSLKTEIDKLQGEITSGQQEIKALTDSMAKEFTGHGLSHRRGIGPQYNSYKSQKDALTQSLPQTIGENTPIINTDKQEIAQIDKEIAKISRPVPEDIKFTGLSSQMDALKRLTSKNSYVLFAYWIFFALILGIETAPVFVKFFTPKGSYDEILAMNEYLVYLAQQKRKSDLHEVINSEITALRSINQRKNAAQDTVNDELLSAIATAQGEIAKKAVELWKKRQLRTVGKNLDSFVRTAGKDKGTEPD